MTVYPDLKPPHGDAILSVYPPLQSADGVLPVRHHWSERRTNTLSESAAPREACARASAGNRLLRGRKTEGERD